MISGFISNFLKFPEKSAIIIEGKTYSYRQLMKIAVGISRKIKSGSSKNEKLIGIYTDNSVYTYASIIAVLLSGSGFVPINKKFPADKLRNIISSSGIRTVLSNAGSADELKLAAAGSNIEILANDLAAEDSSAILPEELRVSRQSETAYVLFTSGSTGIPKGIGITHDNFRAFLDAMTKSGNYDFSSSDSFLQIFELSFDVSIACTFIAWEVGAALVPVPTEGIVFIRALEIIKEHSVTVVSMAPSALAYMKQLRLLDEFSFPQVRYTFLTGEALPYNLAQAWKETAPVSIIENAYGPTEVTVWSAMYRLNDNTPNEVMNGLVPIGKMLPGLTYSVCDEHLKPVKKGAFGEMLLYGRQVAAGYWNDPAKTSASFIKYREAEFPGNWYKTGDIVVENEYDNVMYVNRKDNQVQINGFRVELGEIEFRIKEYTKKDAAVVLPFETNNTLILLAFIENLSDPGDLKKHLAATLPSYMIPKKFYSINVMPLNNSGKIDRKKLLELHHEN